MAPAKRRGDSTSKYFKALRSCSSQDVAHEPMLRRVLEACLRRLQSWRVPPNWSCLDWWKELVQIGWHAGLDAIGEFDRAKGITLESFVYHRVMARSLTQYRREWAHATRLVSNAGNDSLGEEIVLKESTKAILVSVDPRERYHEALREAVGDLPAAQRKLLEQIFWDGFTEKELSVMLKTKRRTICHRKHAALKPLREQFKGSKEV
jgi:RNA polymerase sigma factor (sigma-70 family)